MTREHADAGVTISRRLALQSTGWALGALWLPRLARAQSSGGNDPGFDRFAREWGELAEEMLSESQPDEDRYVYRLSAMIAALGVERLPSRPRDTYANEGMRSGPSYGAGDNFLVEFELEPGAVIRAHNHVGYDFVSVGAKGECHYRHFEPLGTPPPISGGLHEPFELRESRRGILTAGRFSTLTRVRDGIHWFQAGENGATFFDFGTNLKKPGDGWTEFSVMEFDPEPIDREQGIYEGQWIGNPYK